MFQEIDCLTNNARLWNISLKATFVEGGPLSVLTLARDRVHAGWLLLTHPLYGNIQPSQQHFRSVLVGLPDEKREGDLGSISILERAIGLYRAEGVNSVKPARRNRHLEDFAALDVYLLRDSMERYGLLKE